MTKILKIYQKVETSLSYLLSNNCDEGEFLKRKFRNKKITCLDAGSNVGTYIDLIRKKLKTKKIYIFEPSKTCFNFLKKKYKEKKINIFNIALSNKSKKLKFYEKEITSQSTLNTKKNNFFKNLKNRSVYTIKCISLDKFYKINNNKEFYDIIKIDCEGEDYNIIRGAKRLLKNGLIKLIKIEIKFEKDNFYEIVNFLNKFNYKLVTITKTKFNKKHNLDHLDAYFEKKIIKSYHYRN